MKVFISYAQQDAALAGRVAEALQGDGLEVWNAERNLLPGDNWAAEVGRALEESEAMVVLLTSRSHRLAMRHAGDGLRAGCEELQEPVDSGRGWRPQRTSHQRQSHGSFSECLGLNSATAKLPRSSRLRTPFAATRDPAADSSPMPNEVFLSHSSHDREFVNRLSDQAVEADIEQHRQHGLDSTVYGRANFRSKSHP